MIQFTADAAAAANENSYTVAPAGGPYYMGCVDAREEMSKKGNPMLVLEMVVTEGEYENKVRLWHYLTFIPAGEKGHGLTVNALKAFGMKYDGELTINAEDFVGVKVSVMLDVETYNGKTKNVIKKFVTTDSVEAEVKEPVMAAAAAVFKPAKAPVTKKKGLPW